MQLFCGDPSDACGIASARQEDADSPRDEPALLLIRISRMAFSRCAHPGRRLKQPWRNDTYQVEATVTSADNAMPPLYALMSGSALFHMRHNDPDLLGNSLPRPSLCMSCISLRAHRPSADADKRNQAVLICHI
jgi:hypothetical protein